VAVFKRGRYRNNSDDTGVLDPDEFQKCGFQILEKLRLESSDYSGLLRAILGRTWSEAFRSIIVFAMVAALSMVPGLLFYSVGKMSADFATRHLAEYVAIIVCYMCCVPFYYWIYSLLATSVYVLIERELVPGIWLRVLDGDIEVWRGLSQEALEESFRFAVSQKQFLGTVCFPILVSFGQCIWAGLLLGATSKTAAIVALLFVVFRMGVVLTIAKVRNRRELEAWSAKQDWTTFARDLVEGLSSIRTLRVEVVVAKKWQQISERRIRADAAVKSTEHLVQTVSVGSFILYSGLWLVVVFSSERNANVSAATLILLYSLFAQIFLALGRLDSAILFWGQYAVGEEKLRPLLDLGRKTSLEESLEVHRVEHLEFRNISFAYCDQPLFTDLSLNIKSGDVVLVVGPSGSGKTTLIQLLLGLQKPTSGQVFWNNASLDEFQCSTLRKRFGVVLQDVVPTGRTIRDAVQSDLQRGDDDIWQALRMACFEDQVARMPLELSTPIGEGGVMLSSGQRQRLLIAMALLRRPDVIVLDEALSSLGSETIEQIIDGIKAVVSIVIVVAHRTDCFRSASTIVDLSGSTLSVRHISEEVRDVGEPAQGELESRQKE